MTGEKENSSAEPEVSHCAGVWLSQTGRLARQAGSSVMVLQRCRDRQRAPPGYAGKTLLGYILSTPRTGSARPLYRYRLGGGAFVTTTSGPPPGAQDVQLQGYLPR